jgi:hypothetical protein
LSWCKPRVRTGSKSANIFQVYTFIFRTDSQTSQGALPQLPQTRNKEGLMDSGRRFETDRPDKFVWEKLENYLGEFLRQNSKSN